MIYHPSVDIYQQFCIIHDPDRMTNPSHKFSPVYYNPYYSIATLKCVFPGRGVWGTAGCRQNVRGTGTATGNGNIHGRIKRKLHTSKEFLEFE
jgi:hypothetical protein